MNSTSDVFDAYSRYYDLLYKDKDYESEVNYVDKLLRKYGMQGNDVLEFGSGTGKHGRLLAERNYNVTGVERSARMLAMSKDTNGFSSFQGDICKVKMGRTYDAVLSLFHVISYQVSNNALRSVFARAAEHLLPRGLFIFDIWYSPAVYTQSVEVRIKRISDEDTNIIRMAEPNIFYNENRVDVNYTIIAQDINTSSMNSFTETHSMRHFSLPEIDYLASQNGFKVLGAEEFLTGLKPSKNTWGVCLVLQKT
jgi:SAM-dependent methyltransferase